MGALFAEVFIFMRAIILALSPSGVALARQSSSYTDAPTNLKNLLSSVSHQAENFKIKLVQLKRCHQTFKRLRNFYSLTYIPLLFFLTVYSTIFLLFLLCVFGGKLNWKVSRFGLSHTHADIRQRRHNRQR